jgi:C-terminal processing protease CtpA/Prc
MEGLHNYEGMCIKVIPNKTTYKGKMYVLTGNITASTCEPIVYGLKLQKRAVIVGENTAGKMLSAEPFPLSDEFQVYVPIGDYYAADGKRLDQKGAEPDHKVPSAKAYDFVIEKLINQK